MKRAESYPNPLAPSSPNMQSSTPTSLTVDPSYPASGIYAMGYLDDTYPHEKIGSNPPFLSHSSASPLPSPSTSNHPSANEKQSTWGSSGRSTAGVTKRRCKADCKHIDCNNLIRKSHTFSGIGHAAHEKLSHMHDSMWDSNSITPPPHPSYYAGVHTCDVPHCQFGTQPPQLTAKQKRHMKRAEEREVVAIVLDTLLQIAAFTTAVVFGIWAVKSYNVSVTTLKVQYVANQLSLRALCSSGNTTLAGDPVCGAVLRQTLTQLLDPGLTTDVLASVGPREEEEGSNGGSGKKLSLGGIVGIVFGVVAFILGNLAVAAWRRFAMLRKVNRHVGTANCVDE